MRSSLLMNSALALVLVGAVSSSRATVAASDAVAGTVTDKLVTTMESALRDSPEITSRASRRGADVAAMRSESGAGSPVLSWQREGLGSGFDREPNSADYLRLTLPFQPPWRRGPVKSVLGAAEALLEVGVAAESLEVAALAGVSWLDLAAEVERVGLAERRVERLEQALVIQTRRYELGEISGSERTQLELALARERAALSAAEVQRLAAERSITALVPGDFPRPEIEDLTHLVDDIRGLLPDWTALAARVATAPLLRLTEIEGEIARAEMKRQRFDAWGRPELEIEWERIPDLATAAGFDALGFRIGVPLPVGRQGRQRMIAAQRRAETAAADRDRLRLELEARLRAALDTAVTAEASLDLLRATADRMPTAERSLSEQFRLGAVSYVVYLDGLFRLDEVRRAMIETRYTLSVARLELARLLGTDDHFPLPRWEDEDLR